MLDVEHRCHLGKKKCMNMPPSAIVALARMKLTSQPEVAGEHEANSDAAACLGGKPLQILRQTGRDAGRPGAAPARKRKRLHIVNSKRPSIRLCTITRSGCPAGGFLPTHTSSAATAGMSPRGGFSPRVIGLEATLGAVTEDWRKSAASLSRAGLRRALVPAMAEWPGRNSVAVTVDKERDATDGALPGFSQPDI
ncbi:hypothetical protein PWT90_11170 [Aphanocladium album]|nr:hypothetical protein PWT90_11170 [Aphanocladium album]